MPGEEAFCELMYLLLYDEKDLCGKMWDEYEKQHESPISILRETMTYNFDIFPGKTAAPCYDFAKEIIHLQKSLYDLVQTHAVEAPSVAPPAEVVVERGFLPDNTAQGLQARHVLYTQTASTILSTHMAEFRAKGEVLAQLAACADSLASSSPKTLAQIFVSLGGALVTVIKAIKDIDAVDPDKLIPRGAYETAHVQFRGVCSDYIMELVSKYSEVLGPYSCVPSGDRGSGAVGRVLQVVRRQGGHSRRPPVDRRL